MLPSKGQRFELPLGDGDRLVGFESPGNSNTVVYLFHGLAGSTDSTYMHRSAHVAASFGHTVIMTNHRGCGEGQGLAKGPHHSGRAEDLSAVIEHGRKKFPRHRHLAIGFSLGGNALLLLQAGRRGSHQPDAAISVNAPIHLQSTALNLKQGLNRVYDIDFFFRCKRGVEKTHGEKFELPWLATLHDFDNLYTAPAAGFRDREDYYSTCSTWNLLGEIRTPTIALTASDDPFVSVDYYKQAALSSNVKLHIEEFGGHLGYLSDRPTPLGSRRWLDYFVREAMHALE